MYVLYVSFHFYFSFFFLMVAAHFFMTTDRLKLVTQATNIRKRASYAIETLTPPVTGVIDMSDRNPLES